MSRLLLTFYTGIVLVATMAIGYHPQVISEGYEGSHSVLWADSVTSRDYDGPKLFATVGNIEKFFTDRNIGVNIAGDRYELLYKRIY